MRPFHVNLHLGGEWSEVGDYVGGFMRRIGPIAPNEVCYWDFVEEIKKQGIAGTIIGIWYVPPGKNLNKKIKLFRDCEILDLCRKAQVNGEIDVYVLHEIDFSLGLSDKEMEFDTVGEVGEDVSANDNESDSVEDTSSDDDGGDNMGESPDLEVTDYEDENDVSQPFVVGQEFADPKSFKDVVLAYSLREHRNLKFNRSCSSKISAVCNLDGCPWRIYASFDRRTNKFRVKSLNNEHRCASDGSNRLVKGKRLADMFIDAIRVNPRMKAKDMRSLVIADHNVRVSLPTCRHARQTCLEILDREQAEQFGRLWDYVAELKRSNPGSSIELETSGNIFNRVYICFNALMDGWIRGCRRVIHLDGCFLKWHVKGELLSAIGRDANDQMFPIAWAVVQVENKENWEWFIRHIIDDLRLGQGEGLTLVTDQQKGLLYAISQFLPVAEHRMCARHIYSNWKKINKGVELKKLFWKAAKSYNRISFDRCIEEISEISYDAYSSLMKYDARHWSRAFFSTHAKCDAVDNNMGESFNAAIREYRTKPVVQMLEDIRIWVMTSFASRIDDIRAWHGQITPRAEYLIEEQKKFTSSCRLNKNGRGRYEVAQGIDRFVVQLRPYVECSCWRYEVSGIPCCHVICAIWDDSRGTVGPEQLVSSYWTTDFWNASYHNMLQPVNGMNLWEFTTAQVVIPPPNRKMPGAPNKKNRIRDPYESPTRKGQISRHGRIMTCKRCNEPGHNTRTCPVNPADIQSPQVEKRPRGRPRKNQVDGAGPSQPRRQKKNASDGASSSQQTTQPSQPPPIEQSQPQARQPRYQEGYGVYNSPLTGETYFYTGRRVMDMRDNTVFSSTLLRQRERQKLRIMRGRGHLP